jgi:hypothetical protein
MIIGNAPEHNFFYLPVAGQVNRYNQDYTLKASSITNYVMVKPLFLLSYRSPPDAQLPQYTENITQNIQLSIF